MVELVPLVAGGVLQPAIARHCEIHGRLGQTPTCRHLNSGSLIRYSDNFDSVLLADSDHVASMLQKASAANPGSATKRADRLQARRAGRRPRRLSRRCAVPDCRRRIMLLGPNFLWPRPLHHEKRVWRYLWEESPASASRNPWVCWTFSRRSPSRASSVCPNVGPNRCGFNVSAAAYRPRRNSIIRR